MAFNGNLITLKDESPRLKNIGIKVATYRRIANIPAHIFAERCGISDNELEACEYGWYKKLGIAQVLRFAEELGVSYYDLYEADDDRYYSNIKDDKAFSFIFEKVQLYPAAKITKELGLNRNFIYGTKNKNYIPSPFVLANVMTLLKISSVDFRNEERAKKPAETTEAKEETKAPDVDALNEVIKAVNVYKNVDTLKAELNEIISKAQNLLNMLGA